MHPFPSLSHSTILTHMKYLHWTIQHPSSHPVFPHLTIRQSQLTSDATQYHQIPLQVSSTLHNVSCNCWYIVSFAFGEDFFVQLQAPKRGNLLLFLSPKGTVVDDKTKHLVAPVSIRACTRSPYVDAVTTINALSSIFFCFPCFQWYCR